jgi:hypothetical protein
VCVYCAVRAEALNMEQVNFLLQWVNYMLCLIKWRREMRCNVFSVKGQYKLFEGSVVLGAACSVLDIANIFISFPKVFKAVTLYLLPSKFRVCAILNDHVLYCSCW